MSDSSLNISSRALLPFLEELDSPRSLAVAIMLRNDDWVGISSLSTDPRNYLEPLSYFRDRQATDLLRKVVGKSIPGVDRRNAAFKKWQSGEAQCYRTNERLAKFNYGGFLQPSDLAILRFFRKVGKQISHWIGHAPPDLDQIRGKFGPGSTFIDRGRLTTVPDKMTSEPALTDGASWYVLPWVQSHWGRFAAANRRELSWVRGNRYLTVPKTILIDRSIAVEPSINVFYQLGLGTSIRQRLRTFAKWDLDCAQDIHRRKAMESSVTREFATLDLSNASDTVAIELVRLLLPPKWFAELNALRSPFTLVDGHWHKLEKFSSMGNGYTFELETLIFAALCAVLLRENGSQGVLGDDLFVFGDDIILPDHLMREAVAVLNYCGFSVNTEKTFSGPFGFRESCGGDFFEGADVRPFSLKESVNDPWQLLPDLNGLRRSLKKLSSLTGKELNEAPLLGLRDLLPEPVKSARGPEQLGDVCLHSEESRWRWKWENGIRYIRAVKPIPRLLPWHHWHPDVILASAVYGVGDGALGVTPRDPELSYKMDWVPYS
jgi:hypothetical protein